MLNTSAAPTVPERVVRSETQLLQGTTPGPARQLPAIDAAAVSPRVYLPLAKQAPRVTILFASQRDASNALVNPKTIFPYGIVRLYHDAIVAGALGKSYREAWYIDGEYQSQLDYGPISVPYETTIFAGQGIHYASGQALNRGTYRIDIYLNGSLYATATAVIA